MRTTYFYFVRYCDLNGYNHRVGLWSYNDEHDYAFWRFHGKRHRVNGWSSVFDGKYNLYGKVLNLNIGKLVI